MKTFLFILLVSSGMVFAQYYRHVQVRMWHLRQRNIEIQHQLNRLQLELYNAKTT